MTQNKVHKAELLVFLIAAIVLGIGIYYLGPSITGVVIKEFSYADNVNLVVASSGNYTWELKNIGELKSVKIDGRVTNYGKARVYIEDSGKRYLIFDSARIGEEKVIAKNESKISITGLAVNEGNGKETGKNESENKGQNKTGGDENKTGSDEENEKKNKKPEWSSETEEFIVNGMLSINLSQYFKDDDKDTLTYAVSQAEGLETSISNEIATIKAAPGNNFNTTVTLTASDGLGSKSHTVRIEVISEKKEIPQNRAPAWNSKTDSFIINGTLKINLSQYFTDEDNDTLAYSAADAKNITIAVDNEEATFIPADNFSGIASAILSAYDGRIFTSKAVALIVLQRNYANATQPIANETNASVSANKTITIKLDYQSGTVYDANDNGEESVNGVVDLTVKGTEFNWDADASKLCARWEVYNAEDEKLTTFCNGNSGCCGFLGLLPAKNNWSEAYYSTIGKDGAGHKNIVSAQVIYYDVNLSAENPKSEVYNSEWSNKSVRFFEEETEFSGECIETCALSGLNKSAYNLVFEIEGNAVLRIDKIKYSILADAANRQPILLQNFSAVNVSKNKNATINLSKYFSDADGNSLSYNYYKPDNITILFDGDAATIVPDKGISGIRFAYITANDSESAAVSDVFMINVTEQKFKPKVEIGKPVKWQKKILIDTINSSSVNLSLPEGSTNFTVRILNQTEEKELGFDKIKVIDEGKVKDKGTFELEKNIESIRKKIGILEEARQKNALSVEIDNDRFEKSEINSKLNELSNKKAELENQLSRLSGANSNFMTGNIAASSEALSETNVNESKPTLFINESLAENAEVTVEYETPAPISIEDEINPYTKQIKIVSDTHYDDVLSYTTLNDVPQNAIKLYWLTGNGKELFNDVTYYDGNSNGLVDRIEWVVPHLSNQTFEVSITVLNVQSYPTVGGNWTVRFNTTGTGNLTIFAFNGTTYAEVPDDSSTINDLEYLETRCNDAVLNTTIVCANGEQMPYEVYRIKNRIAEIKKRLNELNQTG